MKINEILTVAEKAMPMILDREHEYFDILREQYRESQITKVENTGVGFSVIYEVPDKMEKIPGSPNFHFANIQVRMDDLENGMQLTLFVSEGEIDWLEGHSFGFRLPDEVKNLTLEKPPPEYQKSMRELVGDQ